MKGERARNGKTANHGKRTMSIIKGPKNRKPAKMGNIELSDGDEIKIKNALIFFF